jgi:hypothetical protein
MLAAEGCPVLDLLLLHKIHGCLLEDRQHGTHKPLLLLLAHAHTGYQVFAPKLVKPMAHETPMASPAVQQLKGKSRLPRAPEHTLLPPIWPELATTLRRPAFAVLELHIHGCVAEEYPAGGVLPVPAPASHLVEMGFSPVHLLALLARHQPLPCAGSDGGGERQRPFGAGQDRVVNVLVVLGPTGHCISRYTGEPPLSCLKVKHLPEKGLKLARGHVRVTSPPLLLLLLLLLAPLPLPLSLLLLLLLVGVCVPAVSLAAGGAAHPSSLLLLEDPKSG